MPLRLLIGRAGTGKTATCLREIGQKLSSAPHGAPLILLVPEQSTYITEKALVNAPGIFGSTRAEVLSFGRLTYRLLQQVGENPRPVLEPIGRQMALAKMIHGRKKELTVFGRGAQKPGFAEALSDLLKEFAHYNIGPADLDRLIAQTETRTLGQNLGRKLKDISLLYADWISFAAEYGYLRPEENLHDILRLLQKTDFLQEAELWVDGFATFTPQELAVLNVLMQKAKQTTVALCYEPALYGAKTGFARPCILPSLANRRAIKKNGC